MHQFRNYLVQEFTRGEAKQQPGCGTSPRWREAVGRRAAARVGVPRPRRRSGGRGRRQHHGGRGRGAPPRPRGNGAVAVSRSSQQTAGLRGNGELGCRLSHGRGRSKLQKTLLFLKKKKKQKTLLYFFFRKHHVLCNLFAKITDRRISFC